MNDNVEKTSLLLRFETISRKLARDCQMLKNIGRTWNLKDSTAITSGLDSLTAELTEAAVVVKEEMEEKFDEIKSHLNTQEYFTSLERELKNLGVPFSGEFPVYEIPPFKLSVSLENYEVRLSLGRKNERSALLNPVELAKWVYSRHKRVSGRKFNSGAFMKDLLEAYKIINQIKFREKDVSWGRAVSLNDIYDVLTLKQSSRQDYPKQFFMYDLGLLKEMASISMEGYRFELGFARNQAKAILIVDSLGRESRISSLTVYKEVE